MYDECLVLSIMEGLSSVINKALVSRKATVSPHILVQTRRTRIPHQILHAIVSS